MIKLHFLLVFVFAFVCFKSCRSEFHKALHISEATDTSENKTISRLD